MIPLILGARDHRYNIQMAHQDHRRQGRILAGPRVEKAEGSHGVEAILWNMSRCYVTGAESHLIEEIANAAAPGFSSPLLPEESSNRVPMGRSQWRPDCTPTGIHG